MSAIHWVWNTFKSVILVPEVFFRQLGDEDWKDKPLTYLIWVSWVVGFGATFMIFMNKYLPVGLTFMQEINFWQFLLVIPVFLAVIFIFFSMTYVIVGGVFVTAFYLLLLLITFFFKSLTKQNWEKLFPAVLYSGSVLLLTLVIFISAVLMAQLHLPDLVFRIIFNIVYLAACFYFWRIWGVLLVEKGGLVPSKAKLNAFWAILPFLLVGILVGTKLFGKISGMLI